MLAFKEILVDLNATVRLQLDGHSRRHSCAVHCTANHFFT